MNSLELYLKKKNWNLKMQEKKHLQIARKMVAFFFFFLKKKSNILNAKL